MDDDVRAAVAADLDSRRGAAPGTLAADRVVVEWLGGPGPAPFRVRKRDFEFVVDEPVERGGTDTAPNPLAFFLAGAASCLANHYASLAITEGLACTRLRIAAVGHFDRVLTGGAFRDITYDVQIDTAAPVEGIRELAERADAMCFASNTLANAGVLLTSTVRLNGTVVATLQRGRPG